MSSNSVRVTAVSIVVLFSLCSLPGGTALQVCPRAGNEQDMVDLFCEAQTTDGNFACRSLICSKYLYCKDSIAKVKTCRSGRLFDVTTRRCQNRAAVSCNPRPISLTSPRRLSPKRNPKRPPTKLSPTPRISPRRSPKPSRPKSSPKMSPLPRTYPRRSPKPSTKPSPPKIFSKISPKPRISPRPSPKPSPKPRRKPSPRKVSPRISPRPSPTPERPPPNSNKFFYGLTITSENVKNFDLRGVGVLDIDFDVMADQLEGSTSKVTDYLRQKYPIAKLVCYFSGGTVEVDRQETDATRRGVVYPTSWQPYIGNKMEDWNEYWVDIRQSKIVNIMKGRVDFAANQGCWGVELDNVDGYTFPNTGLGLTQSQTQVFLSTMADYVHRKGMQFGLKNALEIVANAADGLINKLDFFINEECFSFGDSDMGDECSLYNRVLRKGKQVYVVQYCNGRYKGGYNTDPACYCGKVPQGMSISISDRCLTLPSKTCEEYCAGLPSKSCRSTVGKNCYGKNANYNICKSLFKADGTTCE